MKGVRIGDAQVSTVHANFIVNLGNAKAKDVLALAELMRETVKAKFGITLEYEVQIVGEDE
jgi:UDP-N-acetylmuramate dehydrogenase